MCGGVKKHEVVRMALYEPASDEDTDGEYLREYERAYWEEAIWAWRTSGTSRETSTPTKGPFDEMS